MKKIYLYAMALGLMFASCEDFLTEYPKNKITPDDFFKTEREISLYANSFYEKDMPGVGVATGDGVSDIMEVVSVSSYLSSGYGPDNQGGWSWSDLRNINYFIDRLKQSPVCDDIKNKYMGLAKFWRAKFYFEKVKTFGGVPYYDYCLEPDDEALYNGASNPKETMSPELLLVDYKDEELSEIIEDEDGDKVQIEALLIANRIRSLMENGMVTDKKTGQLRAVQYRDIVILSRSVATWGNTVAAVLKDCDIPAHVESNTGYFSSYEIQVILSMLRILDNPLQDIPMAAVLASPIVGMDDEELAQIRSAFKGVSFAQAALSAMAGEDGYEDEKLKAFALVFERLRGAVADTPIHELLYMMLDETGFYRYASAMPAGKRRRQNIDMLIEMAAAYEKTSYKGLFHFVRYIDIQQKYEIDYGEADTAGVNDDVVRIMTIHKSKGLEFPVVFVSGLGKGFNTQDTKSDLVIHEKLGLGLVEKTKSPRKSGRGQVSVCPSFTECLKKKKKIVEKRKKFLQSSDGESIIVPSSWQNAQTP